MTEAKEEARPNQGMARTKREAEQCLCGGITSGGNFAAPDIVQPLRQGSLSARVLFTERLL